MAWTSPRTWTTGETVTAALMNAHVRDNLLETGPAVVTTAGDIVYADTANSLTRLAIGGAHQFLKGGTGVPAWSNTLDGALMVNASQLHLRMKQSDSVIDVDDYWGLEHNGSANQLRLFYYDDSDASSEILLEMVPGDYLLHTGSVSAGAGAVVVGTDETTTPLSVTTSGSIYLEATVETGGPAYIRGFYDLRISRDSAASASQLTILVRQDGSNLSSEFGESSGSTFIADAIPAASDEMGYHGTFWRRVTVSDTSDYEIFVVAANNSIFSIESGSLYVESMQYPT